ncbi:MAG: queuosine precursor transporter [Chloroflexota bacterium]
MTSSNQPVKVSYWFVFINSIFVTCFITANIIGVKWVALGPVVLPAAVILFPLSYIIADVLTEVYGYRLMRRVIWLGFLCNLIFVVFAQAGQVLPPAPSWEWQGAYETILGYTPRLLVASFCGYLAGSFANSFIMAKMKVLTGGRWLWSRTIGSTIIGEGLDTAIFVVLGFVGEPFFVPVTILYHWLAKVGIELLATPVVYLVVDRLKKKEMLDTYDRETDFNPFRI